MKIYNSLSRSLEEFVPINPPKVGMYTCGPTVYHYATIGNFRSYTTADLFRNLLEANGYDVTYIMNITDVGHLSGDNAGDASTGQDRMEIAAARESKTAWEIADFYYREFVHDFEQLKLKKPTEWTKATDYIQEQIALVKTLEEKGFVYRITDGLYFDTEKFPTYGEISNLQQILEGARVEANPEKKNPRDFALWKFSPEGTKRQMEWESPWGIGFPGWHVECSAMSMKFLGNHFDVHFGGEDLRSTHHPNEIAQSEAATGEKFVNYWLHAAFLMVDSQRMGKSLGNAYTVKDIAAKGFDPVALKYFYYTGHYKSPINFTWEAMEAANTAYLKLRSFMEREQVAGGAVNAQWWEKFLAPLNEDLNTSVALSVVWALLKDADISTEDKVATLLRFDEVLGFGLKDITKTQPELIPEEVQELVKKRDEARATKNWGRADELRSEIERLGFEVKDVEGRSELRKA